MFNRYLILTRGIEEGLLASTREKHNTVLETVNKQHYNHHIFYKLCNNVFAAKNFRAKEHPILCAVSLLFFHLTTA